MGLFERVGVHATWDMHRARVQLRWVMHIYTELFKWTLYFHIMCAPCVRVTAVEARILTW